MRPTPAAVRPLVLLAAVLLAIPATRAAAQGPAPATIAKLEKARDRAPNAVPALRALGVAYFKAGRAADARRVLEQAHALAPRDGVVALYLGLAAEQIGDLPAARAAYTSYLEVGRTSRTRGRLRARLAALEQQEIRAAAKQAVANEAALAAQPGAPTTVAVLPLRFTGADSSLMPLERGLSELLVTDLARSPRLTLLERARVQAMLDEMRLAQGAQADPATAVRTGRLVRAGRIVQGSITQLPGRRLAVNAAVVDVPTTQVVGTARQDDQLDALFALEKRVALDLFQALGITLSPQERAAVEERPTRSLAAFLAYSNGLVAEDAGNLDEARRLYQRAGEIDPGFRAAQQRQARAEAARQGQQLTASAVEGSLSGTEGAIAAGATGAGDLGGTLVSLVNDLNPSIAVQMQGGTTTATQPSNRDPASSATGTDSPSRSTGRITIVVRQPRQ